MRCAGLVLAAGAGTRLGRPKALVEIGGRRLVDHAVDVLGAGGAEPVFVVVGAAAVGHVDAVVVRNTDWRAGMASSLRAGLRAASSFDRDVAPLDAVLITLVDQVEITRAAVRRVALAAAGGARAAAATYAGQRRHPVLIRTEDWAEVMAAAAADAGAREVLARWADEVLDVPCDDVGSGLDVDTEADLAAARQRALSASRGPHLEHP